jgi:hypothetical protein
VALAHVGLLSATRQAAGRTEGEEQAVFAGSSAQLLGAGLFGR